jgi:pectate lyase
MKLPQLSLLAAIITFGSPGATRAAVLLDDTWADGNRTTQNLPTDSAWYCSSSSALVATTGSMTLTMPSSAIMALTYFTSDASAPVQLNVGDTLTATISFSFNGLAAANTSGAFRIGLFDFADSTLSPKHVSADLTSNNGQGSGVQGYALFQSLGTGFNNSNPMDLRKRTTPTDNGLLGSSGDWTSEATGPGNTSGFPGFVNGTQYSLQLSLKRTNLTSLVFTVTWINPATGASLSTSWVDAGATTFNFDGIALRPSGSASTASTITFNEVKVEVVSGSVAPLIDLQPVDQTVLAGATASFSVLAGGTAPLAYQWFFNTNTPLADATNSTLTLTNLQTTNGGVYSVLVSNAIGSVISSNALLTVNLPVGPAIVSQPRSQTVLPGETATFSVEAGGSEPLSYQWYYNTNTLLTNATDATLILTNVQPGDAGSYSVLVSNVVNALTSSFAILTINTNPVAPSFSSQPASVVALTGGSASFSVIVSGSGPISYQWMKDGVAVSNATSATLMLTNVQISDAGSYTLTASNSVAVVRSDPAILSVTTAVPVAYSAYNLTGFGQGTTGGGVLADTDPNYAKVYTATDLANAISSKTVKIIEIMNDLDLGYNEIEAGAKAASEPFRAHNPPQLHPRLLVTGVSLIDIQKKNGLTIFSANGATIRHATFNIKSSGNVIVRNLKFDEMWEWDEASKGDYDKNDWDFMDLGNSGTVSNIWVDHCTFTKAYDGICDIKTGSFNITFSWNKYVGDDGATNTNSWVWQQINSLESNRTSHAMYNFLRVNGFSLRDIVTIIQGHDKTHLVGATTDSINAQHTLTFHHQWYMNPWDRLPRLRGGNVHNYNIYVDDTLGLAAKRLRDARAAAMSAANQHTLSTTYSFNPFLNGSISTEGGAMLVEKSVYIDCLTPLRNNQTDPSDSFYTGKIMALDTISQMDNTDGTTTLVRGNSTDAGNPLGPFQAPSIDFSWNLPDNRLPYSYTMDDPSQLKAIVTSPTAGAGAGVLAWAKTNWLQTSYPASAPFIVADPQSQVVPASGTAVFVVVAGGSAPLTYQWYFNTNTPVSSATNATLTLTNAQAEDAGAYSVLVSNSVGFASSLSALLTVNPTASGFILWQTAQFTADELNNPAISGPDATPAGDGVPNFVKYALGLAPLVPATQPLVSFRYDSGEGVLSYYRPVSVADVVYHVVASTNLTDWTENGVVQQMVGPATNGLQSWEVRYSGPAATTRFFQLVLQP